LFVTFGLAVLEVDNGGFLAHRRDRKGTKMRQKTVGGDDEELPQEDEALINEEEEK